jgi:hypothetical protein
VYQQTHATPSHRQMQPVSCRSSMIRLSARPMQVFTNSAVTVCTFQLCTLQLPRMYLHLTCACTHTYSSTHPCPVRRSSNKRRRSTAWGAWGSTAEIRNFELHRDCSTVHGRKGIRMGLHQCRPRMYLLRRTQPTFKWERRSM